MGTHPIFESDFDCLTDGTTDPVVDSNKKENIFNMEPLLKDLVFLLLPKPANHVPGPLAKWILPSAPSKTTVKLVLYAVYFLLIGGVVYDLQYQPQGMGQYVDKNTGQMRPMTFVQGRINAQFLIEGFVASIMTAVGAFGLITVNYANQDGLERRSCFCWLVDSWRWWRRWFRCM